MLLRLCAPPPGFYIEVAPLFLLQERTVGADEEQTQRHRQVLHLGDVVKPGWEVGEPSTRMVLTIVLVVVWKC
jgi:hypothetical protein